MTTRGNGVGRAAPERGSALVTAVVVTMLIGTLALLTIMS